MRQRTGGRWLRGFALPVAPAAMDLCWLWPWALLIGLWLRPTDSDAVVPLLSAPSILSLLLAARAAMRTAVARRWPPRRMRVSLLALGFAAVLLAVRLDHYAGRPPSDLTWVAALAGDLAESLTRFSAPVLATALGLYVWRRGIVHGRDPVDYEGLRGAFRFGVLALAGALVAAMASAPDLSRPFEAWIGPYVLAYLFAGLTSLSVARLVAVRTQSRAGGDGALALNGDWLATVLGIAAALLLFTLALAQLLSFDLIATVVAPALRLLGAITWLLFYAIALPIGLLMEVLVFLARLTLRPDSPQPPPRPPGPSYLQQLREEGAAHSLPPEAALAAKWLAIVLLSVLALLLVARAVFRWHAVGRDDGVVEERDSVWAWGSLRAALAGWWRSLWRRFVARRAPAAPAARAAPGGPQGSGRALTIRQIYRQLLRLGAAAGVNRARAATPYDHLPRLQARLQPEEDLTQITAAYVRARYGPAEPPASEVEEVRTRWERVLSAERSPLAGTDPGVGSRSRGEE